MGGATREKLCLHRGRQIIRCKRLSVIKWPCRFSRRFGGVNLLRPKGRGVQTQAAVLKGDCVYKKAKIKLTIFPL